MGKKVESKVPSLGFVVVLSLLSCRSPFPASRIQKVYIVESALPFGVQYT